MLNQIDTGTIRSNVYKRKGKAAVIRVTLNRDNNMDIQGFLIHDQQ